jgi:plastocyanin
MLVSRFVRLGALCATTAIVLTATACGGKRDARTSAADPGASSGGAAPGGAPASTGPQTPDAGGKIIAIEALTDEQGNNVFRPDNFEAHQGDVIRFTLGAGVHNVHFLPDSNPGRKGLPAASDMLQLPGQTYDVKVSFAPGRYYFQCDPHAALGMVGHVKVEAED